MLEASTQSTRPPTVKHARAWLVAALVFVLLRALPNLSYPLGRDQATYCVIGQGLLDGGQLYRDFWDNRPPGLPYIFTVIVKVFGPVMWCVGVVDILWLLVIAYLIFRFTERYLGAGAAAVAVVVAASWHVATGYWQAAQAETFLMVFVFAAFFTVAREGPWPKLRHVAAGLLFGAAFWLKYNALAFLPFVLVLPYLDFTGLDSEPRRLRGLISGACWTSRAAAFAAGLGGVIAAVLAYFWVADSWPALKEVQFEVLPRYAAIALERTPHYGLWAAGRIQTVLGLWTELATLAALLVAWNRRELGRLAPILLAAGMALVSAVSQVRLHDYYFETCYPFFAMIWGYLGLNIYQGFRSLASAGAARRWPLARTLVWVVFANVIALPLPDQAVNLVVHYRALAEWWRKGDAFYAGYPWPNPASHFRDQMRVISYLRTNLASGESVFVWGNEPLIYFLAERRPPTRFIWNLPLISPWSLPAWRDELVRDLGKAPPRYLIVARHDAVSHITYTEWDSEEYLKTFPELAIFLSDYYELAENLRDFAIYRQRERSRPGTSLSRASPAHR